jgi:hypothetical protein
MKTSMMALLGICGLGFVTGCDLDALDTQADQVRTETQQQADAVRDNAQQSADNVRGAYDNRAEQMRDADGKNVLGGAQNPTVERNADRLETAGESAADRIEDNAESKADAIEDAGEAKADAIEELK